MVRVIARDTLRPIELLRNDKTYELMREHERGQRPREVGACHQGVIYAIRATNHTDNATTGAYERVEFAGKGRGIKLSTTFIEQYYDIARHKLEQYALRLVLTRAVAL